MTDDRYPTDRLDQLYAISASYARRFPDGNHPLGYLTRMTEELGEIAVEVQRLEGSPVKVAKHGPGSVADLASEIEDLLHTAVGLLRCYSAEDAFESVLEREYAKVVATERA